MLTPFLLSAVLLFINAALSINTDNLPLPCGIPFPLTEDTLSKYSNLLNGTLPTAKGTPKHTSRSADVLNHGRDLFSGAHPWKREEDDPKKLAVVRYCYQNEETWQRVSSDFEAATGVWMEALGQPSRENGHGVQFREVERGPMARQYCLQGSEWNPRIPVDTLRIEGTSSIPIATATVGYFYGVTLATSGMFMKLGNSFDVADIVHELGHVLGMEHTHTRQDRDDYVQFRCEKLVGYYEKLGQYMMKKKPEDGPNGLCEDWNIAAWLGFSAADYVKGALPAGEQVPGQSPRTYRLWPVRSSGPYPVESVMQYPSDGAASGLCTKENLKECPLVRYVQPGVGGKPPNKSKGFAWLDRVLEPSKSDVEWVQDNYPWLGEVDASVKDETEIFKNKDVMPETVNLDADFVWADGVGR